MAATRDGVQHLPLCPRQPGPTAFDEALALGANDIGHLEGGPHHFLCLFREWWTISGPDTFRVSSGLATACRCRRERCK
jgi:hypothetical protein